MLQMAPKKKRTGVPAVRNQHLLDKVQKRRNQLAINRKGESRKDKLKNKTRDQIKKIKKAMKDEQKTNLEAVKVTQEKCGKLMMPKKKKKK